MLGYCLDCDQFIFYPWHSIWFPDYCQGWAPEHRPRYKSLHPKNKTKKPKTQISLEDNSKGGYIRFVFHKRV